MKAKKLINEFIQEHYTFLNDATFKLKRVGDNPELQPHGWTGVITIVTTKRAFKIKYLEYKRTPPKNVVVLAIFNIYNIKDQPAMDVVVNGFYDEYKNNPKTKKYWNDILKASI